jgi:hypothetical protein
MSATQPSPPPWIRPEIQAKIAWRDQDIVVSVPPKSGTTWTMNIVYQLLTGGDPDFESVYAEVPWIEFLNRPDQTELEIVDLVAAMPKDQPRAFKTHSAPPELPFIEASEDLTVRYIVIARNPEEAIVSFKPFLSKHTEAWFDLWGIPKQAMMRESFADFYADIINDMGMQAMFFGFIAAWWPLRHQPNVLFLHYADMKRDHNASLQKIADFLGLEPNDTEWEKIREYTGFSWMKAHADKFEPIGESSAPVLETGAMIRSGKIGAAQEDGMNKEIAEDILAIGRQICTDEDAINWLYQGGEIK